MKAQGLDLGTFVTGNAYIASMLVGDLEELLNTPGLRWAGPLEPNDKIDADLETGDIPEAALADDNKKVALTVQFHRDVSAEEAEAVVKALGGAIVTFQGLPATSSEHT